MSAAPAWCSDDKISYNGLMNHGATCYLNSVLQVLFMTEDFRKAVNSHSNTNFIDHHLKDLFDRLKKETSDTSAILKALNINTVNQQQDAAEYCQKILRLTSPEAAKIFHGELTNRRICTSCKTNTDTDESFWILPLSLVNPSREVYSVEDGINEFFKESYFTGEDQMYCEHCDTKVDACTKYVVKHHPEVLILLLKRFDFSYSYMTYIKINDTVDVTTSLKIPENQTYELYAVVDHVGDLRSGHYTSRIRSQVDRRWYQFNDTWVTKINYNINSDIRRSTTAFLLFYRKKDSSLRVLKANKHGRPAARDNHDPIPGDKTYNQNDEEINSEDEHQKIHISEDFDSVGNKLTHSYEDVRRHSNRYLLVDGVNPPAGKKHKEDETLTKAKESETKQKKFDVRVTSEEVKRLHDGKQEDDLEQRSKIDKVMISEIQIKLQSMGANGNNAPNPADLDANSVEQQGENSMESKGISLDLNNIQSFTRKREQNKPSTTRRFRNQKHKLDLLRQKKKLKGTDVYYHLTKKKPEMIRKARFLKKQRRIQNTWVRNQKISINVNGAQEQTTVRKDNMEDSEKCLGTLV